jgi:hypothetical protein
MSAKNRKLTRFHEHQGETDSDERDSPSWIDSEQMERAEGRMAGAPGAEGRGVSDVAAADNPEAVPSGTGEDIGRRRAGVGQARRSSTRKPRDDSGA